MTTIRFAAMAAMGLVLAACGDDVAANPNGELSISGTWRITETITEENCGDGLDSYTYNISLSQNGTAIQVTAFGETYNGTLSGNQLTWTGDIDEDGGVTTSNLSITFSGDDSLSGTSDWSWTDGNFTCEGSSLISGERA